MASPALTALLETLGSNVVVGREISPPALTLGWPEVDALLPDGGFPHGVVELSAPRALGGATLVALAALRAAQARDRASWGAWIDPEASLYAPGVATAGVDLARLLVVRPERSELARVALKLATARAFDVIVIDLDPMPAAVASCELREAREAREALERRAPARETEVRAVWTAAARAAPTAARSSGSPGSPGSSGSSGSSGSLASFPSPVRRGGYPDEILVRKLSLLAVEGGATILLLTDGARERPCPLPVSLRLELARKAPSVLGLRIAKERRGRAGASAAVPLATRPRAFA